MGSNANQQLSVSNLLATMTQNCGAHGIPNIGRSASYHRRIVWSLLFVFSLVVFAGTALSMFGTFKSYDVAVNVEIEYEREVTFPAVTLCNLNRVTKSGAYKNEELRQSLLHHEQGIGKEQHDVSSIIRENKNDRDLSILLDKHEELVSMYRGEQYRTRTQSSIIQDKDTI